MSLTQRALNAIDCAKSNHSILRLKNIFKAAYTHYRHSNCNSSMTKHIRRTSHYQAKHIYKICIFAFVFSIQMTNRYSCKTLSESKNVPSWNISSRSLPFDDSFEMFHLDDLDDSSEMFFRSRSIDNSQMYGGEFQDISSM